MSWLWVGYELSYGLAMCWLWAGYGLSYELSYGLAMIRKFDMDLQILRINQTWYNGCTTDG